MNREFVAATAVGWCILCYWLGGQEIPGLKRGYKWIRRFGLPAGLCIGLLALKPEAWYLVAPACGLLCGALHLGYNTNLWLLPLTGLAMGAPALMLGTFTVAQLVWAVCPALMHLGLGLISRHDNKFVWALVALAMGYVIGVAYVYPVL
jgi:hypothetical protein